MGKVSAGRLDERERSENHKGKEQAALAGVLAMIVRAMPVSLMSRVVPMLMSVVAVAVCAVLTSAVTLALRQRRLVVIIIVGVSHAGSWELLGRVETL